MKVIINQNQKGLLFKNGVLQDFLGAGRYTVFGSKSIEVLQIDEEIRSKNATTAQILTKSIDRYKSNDLISEVTVKNGEICLHYANGVFADALTAGQHIFWNEAGKHEFKIYSTAEPRITDVPATILNALGNGYVTRINVPDQHKAAVKYDGKTDYLDAGCYFYWNGSAAVSVNYYTLKVQMLTVNGQEILTKDKVGVRVNFTANWKIVDYKKISEEYDNIDTLVYSAAQLALRDYLGGKTMDELLADRENIGAELLEELKNRTAEMHVEILSAGIKDVILPGEISAIMNSVLAAEKRAQANVITRREEVASTRSLLNTAKLMDENATLRRLKELEYIEKICENVGEITVDARSSILSQLAQIIGDKADN